MDITNIHEYNLFKAVSEEIRLRIMVLLTEGELCVCDLMEVLTLPQSSVSRHMAKLKASEMVIGRRDQKWVFYRLNTELNSLIPFLTEMLQSFRDRQPYNLDIERLKMHLQTKNDYCKKI